MSLLFVLVVLAALAAALAFSTGRHRGRREEPVLHCQCPACGQKLHSPPCQGRRALCPRCLRVFVVPANVLAHAPSLS
jgi:hypothetical protein